MALRFDANTEYVSRNSGVPSSTSFTMAFWAYIVSDLGAGVAQGLCWLGGSVSTDSIFFLWNNTSGVMEAGVYKASPFGIDLANPASRPAVGTWAFYFMRRSGTASNTFTVGWAPFGGSSFTSANGALIAGTTPGTLSVDTMRIGTTDSITGAANARYAGAKVWDAALSDAELLQEMAKFKPVRTSNVHLWTPFTAPVVTDNLTDRSGNGRNWTASGTHTVESGPSVPFDTATLSITSTPVPGMSRLANKRFSVTMTPVPSVRRAISHAFSIATTPVPRMIRQTGKAFSITTTPVPGIVRRIGKALSIVTTPTPALNASKAFLKTLSITTTPTPSLSMQRAFLKVFSVTTTPAPSLAALFQAGTGPLRRAIRVLFIRR